MVSQDSIFIDLEDAVNDLIEEQGLNEEQSLKLNATWQSMKRDVSIYNLTVQTKELQKVIDSMTNDIGFTPALMLVQARIEQLRVLYELRDSFNTE